MLSNREVCRRFHESKSGKSPNMRSTGNKLYSYNTVIIQRLGNGETIGNITKYSHTTLCHQNIAEVVVSTYLAPDRIPIGTQDLLETWRSM